MAESRTTVAIVLLNGSNYVTWKIQCKMALIKEGLWKIVEGIEVAPSEEDAANHAKFMSRRDRALATVVLAVEPRLLYLIGEPSDPKEVWRKLQEQFQKKSWANKLELRRKLHSLRMKDGESVQEYVRKITELFNALAEIEAPLSEEDRVIYLLASLPESFGVLVTALEASPEVPKMEVVTERLLHEERKMAKNARDFGDEIAMYSRSKGFQVRGHCYRCGKPGHYQRDCRLSKKHDGCEKVKEHRAGVVSENNTALTAARALAAGDMSKSWIVDSGATSHMCYRRDMFRDYKSLPMPEKVMYGDGNGLEAVGRGTVELLVKLPGGRTRAMKLYGTLYVPGMKFNLVSVSTMSEAGMEVGFVASGCEIIDSQKKVVARASKCGSLFFLNCDPNEQIHAAVVSDQRKVFLSWDEEESDDEEFVDEAVKKEIDSEEIEKEIDSEEIENEEIEKEIDSEEIENEEIEKEIDSEEIENEEIEKEIDSEEIENEEIEKEIDSEEIENEEIEKEIDSEEIENEEIEKEIDSEEIENEEIEKEIDSEEIEKEIDSEEIEKEIDSEEIENEEIEKEIDSEEIENEEIEKEIDSEEIENEEIEKEIDSEEIENEEIEKEIDSEEIENEEIEKEIDSEEIENEEIEKEIDSEEIENEEIEKEIDSEEIEKEIDSEEIEKEIDSEEIEKEIDSEEIEKEIDSEEIEKEIDSEEIEKEIDSEEIDSEEIEKEIDSEEIENEEIEKEIDSEEIEKEIDSEEIENEEIEKEIDSEEIENEEIEKEIDSEEIEKEPDEEFTIEEAVYVALEVLEGFQGDAAHLGATLEMMWMWWLASRLRIMPVGGVAFKKIVYDNSGEVESEAGTVSKSHQVRRSVGMCT